MRSMRLIDGTSYAPNIDIPRCGFFGKSPNAYSNQQAPMGGQPGLVRLPDGAVRPASNLVGLLAPRLLILGN